MARNQRHYEPEYKTQAIKLAQETGSCKKVKEQDKEIARIKKENAFLEEASAFFAASRLKSQRTSD